MVNFLIRVVNKTLTFENDLPLRKQTFILEYVQDKIVSRDIENLEIVRKYIINVISGI